MKIQLNFKKKYFFCKIKSSKFIRFFEFFIIFKKTKAVGDGPVVRCKTKSNADIELEMSIVFK